VGVVKQTETAALKAVGNNKSNVFTRELYALYTKSTLIGEDMKVMDGSDDNDGIDTSSAYLMCLCEGAGTLVDKDTASSSRSTSDDSITYGFVVSFSCLKQGTKYPF
jgi:DNA mismatch repair protein MSH3